MKISLFIRPVLIVCIILLLFILVVYPVAQGYAEGVTEWKTEYNKAIKLLPELQKQPLFTDISIRCKSILNMLHVAMTDAEHIILSKTPDKTKTQNVLLKLKQVRIELERVMTEISQADELAIEAKRWETLAAKTDEERELAKSTIETMKEQFEQFKNALKTVKEHLERQIQTIQKLPF